MIGNNLLYYTNHHLKCSTYHLSTINVDPRFQNG